MAEAELFTFPYREVVEALIKKHNPGIRLLLRSWNSRVVFRKEILHKRHTLTWKRQRKVGFKPLWI